MVGRAFDHADLADAAIAALAIMHGIFACFDQHAEYGLVGRNTEGLAGIVQHHFEGLVAGDGYGGGKNLEAQAAVSPAEVFGALDRRIDHRLRPAEIKRLVGGERRHQALDVKNAAGVVGVNGQVLAAQRFAFTEKGELVARAAGIDEAVGPFAGGKRRRHREHRRHADAAGQQHDRFRRRLQRKIVTRRLDLRRRRRP